MTKYFIIFLILLLTFVPFFAGCNTIFSNLPETPTITYTPQATETEEVKYPIIINGGEKYTNNPLVDLDIKFFDVSLMAFSGNGTSWSDWMTYTNTYKKFNLFSCPGCNKLEGTRRVFVKFKKENGEILGPYHSSIILDVTPPYLKSIRWIDKNANYSIDGGDILEITFSEPMDPNSLPLRDIDHALKPFSGTYDAISVIMNDKKDILSIVLGKAVSVGFDDVITPDSSILDMAGNSIDTSISILVPPTFHHKLKSIKVSPTSVNVNYGDSPVFIEVKAYDTKGEDITNLCSFSWSFIGSSNGTLSSSVGSEIYYIPPTTTTTTSTATPTVTASTDSIKVVASHGNNPTVSEIISVNVNP